MWGEDDSKPEGGKGHARHISGVQVRSTGLVVGTPHLLLLQNWHGVVTDDGLRSTQQLLINSDSVESLLIAQEHPLLTSQCQRWWQIFEQQRDYDSRVTTPKFLNNEILFATPTVS